MGWITILWAIIQYGPKIIEAITALINAIKAKNIQQGSAAITKGMDVAVRVILNLEERANLTNDQKREQAWYDIRATLSGMGVTVSESEARTLAELALQRQKNAT